VDLSAKTGITLRGQGWGTTITNAAADELIKLGAQCSLEKLAASNTKAAVAAGVIYGVRAYGANVRVRDCWIASTGTGISSAYDKMRVSRCAVDAGEYAVSFPSAAGTYYGYVDKCTLVTSGWTICNSAAVFAQRTAVYVRDSILDVTIASSDNTHTPIGIYILGAAIRTRCHCINTVMRIAATAGTYASGVRVSGPADVYVDGGYIYMVASGANVFSLDQLTVGTLTVIDLNYDTTITNGTIGQGGSGWGAAVNAEVDTALNTAIPGSPVANSINERVKAIDNKLPSDPYLTGTNTEDGGPDAGWADTFEDECENALEYYNLDHLMGDAVSGSDVVDNSVIAKLASKSATADWSTYAHTTDSMEAVRDRGDASWLTANAQTIVDALMADTGVTAGGSYTFEEFCKAAGAFMLGTWRDKGGAPGVIELVDWEDGSTVIMDLTPSQTTPYKTTSKK
jgi:hypothetical protein